MMRVRRFEQPARRPRTSAQKDGVAAVLTDPCLTVWDERLVRDTGADEHVKDEARHVLISNAVPDVAVFMISALSQSPTKHSSQSFTPSGTDASQ